MPISQSPAVVVVEQKKLIDIWAFCEVSNRYHAPVGAQMGDDFSGSYPGIRNAR